MNTQINSFTQERAVPLHKPANVGNVIYLYPQHKQQISLLDDKRTYLLLHMAVGIALGASLLMMAIAMLTQAWLQRSIGSLLATLSAYALVTGYYHVARNKRSVLFIRGAIIVTLASLVTIMMAAQF